MLFTFGGGGGGGCGGGSSSSSSSIGVLQRAKYLGVEF